MEAKLNVVILAHTPEFEQNIVRGAKLCYSSADIEALKDKVTPEEAQKFLEMILGLGHGSVLEHSCITFGIEGVSRSLTHQLVRHRIASYSQKSQRYVKEGQFSYVIPKDIRNNHRAKEVFIKVMEADQKAYDDLVHILLEGYLEDTDYDTYQELKEDNKNLASKFEKRAIENARAVLPNACETKIQVTMNVRTLFNFFKERCCDRAQDEIRDMAYKMWLECMKISPTIFKHAVPSCVNGKCKEGKMSCGKMAYYKDKHSTLRKVYRHEEDGTKTRVKFEDLKVDDIIEMFEPDNETQVLCDGEPYMRVTEIIAPGKIDVMPYQYML